MCIRDRGEHARFAGRVWKGALAWSLICLMAFAWRPGAAAQQSQKPSDWKIFIANDACSDYTWGDDEKQKMCIRDRPDPYSHTASIGSPVSLNVASISAPGLTWTRL